MELREVTPGLHRWTAPHPEWKPGDDWDQDVGCVSAEAADALVLIDPLVPDDGWDALDRLVERAGFPVARPGRHSRGALLLGEAPASWFSANDEERTWYREGLPHDVAPLLGLPIERVLVSHGEPVLAGGRDALAAALA